ncbi:MAG TPA: HEAT repeat domain-containing protein, partial [Pyrinomonadaceae bacterium]|nr:HEAT repeat domain-containing protein [Pyrinomonadaceae bacterium]
MTVPRLISLALLCACFCCAPLAASAQSAEELRRLLAMPAPTPRAGAPAEGQAQEKPPRPDTFYSEDRQPPDDAPLEDLLDYWTRLGTSPRRAVGPKPSDRVRERLLAAAEADPERLAGLLHYLPETGAAAGRVKRLYEKTQGDSRLEEPWHNNVREWLKLHSKDYLGELLPQARRVKDRGGSVDNKEELKALARVDWESAEPLLQALAGGSAGPRSAALAIALLYRHAREDGDAGAEESWRTRLLEIAADRNAPAWARDAAIEALSLAEWAGRDEWYLSLLKDPTLLSPTDDHYGFNPLTTLFNTDPDKWIPVMTKLLESEDRAVEQAAAACLALYAIDHPRRDAVLPVLRWLTDPDWIKVSPTYRAWFMQTMDDLDIPESVPGLIWIVENDEDDRIWAARTLAHYKDPRAFQALKKALAEEKDEGHRQYIIEGLLGSGGLSEAEQLAALEAYAERISAGEGRQGIERYRAYGDHALPVPVSVGRYLAYEKEVPDGLAAEVLARAESLRKEKPAVARALLGVAERWRMRRVALDMVRRIGEGKADSATIATALGRRDELREAAGAELRLLAGAGGTAQGVAAVMLGDEVLAQNVLGSADRLAQTALLASARLVQMPLPAAQVGALLGSPDELLALAAERYLLAEDGREARALLWERHMNEAFITGWRENVSFIGGENFEAMGRAEEELRAEMLKDGGPVEIFALLVNRDRPANVLRVFRDRAVYTDYEDGARRRERVVPAKELGRFKRFVATSGLEELGPQFGDCHHDCFVSEFLSLTRTRGRRVFSHQGVGGWLTLFTNFGNLGRGPGLKIHYGLSEKIKGLEVLHADESLKALDVWQRGADTRVLFEREWTEEEREQEREDDAAELAAEREDDEAAASEAGRRSTERERARFSWRAFADGRPGAVAPRPDGYSTFDEETYEPGEGEFTHLNENMAQAVAGDALIVAGSFARGGLWKKAPGRAPVRVGGEGKYADPVVTPDGKWAVAARTGTDWARPNYVVRLNLQTGAEFRVGVPPADEFGPVAYLEAHGLVLLRRARTENKYGGKPAGPDAPEYYLLDAATGRTQPATGVFEPLLQGGKRFLQPAGRPAEYWAAIPDRAKNETRVGRYNAKDFSFQPLLVIHSYSSTAWR